VSCERCGGSIVKQMAFGPYPERFYCLSCGREPFLNNPKGKDVTEILQMKICRTCKIEKPVVEFGILNSSKDGRNPVCFECRRKSGTSRIERVNKEKASDQKRRPGRPKIIEPPQKEILAVHGNESAEAQLIKALKKNAIKNFITGDLILFLERAIDERFK